MPIPESLIAVDGSQVFPLFKNKIYKIHTFTLKKKKNQKKIYIYYDETAGCMKKVMDKSISEYEASLIKLNKEMISEFDDKLFCEKLDATKNFDMPFSMSKLLGEYDY